MEVSLYKRWELVKAPLNCRQSMLETIGFELRDDGTATAYNSANISNGKYTISDVSSDGKSGILSIKCKWWTQCCRVWKTKQESEEAKIVNTFIVLLISLPLNYELRDNEMIISTQDHEYVFNGTSLIVTE
jgi:hypothetical protein